MSQTHHHSPAALGVNRPRVKIGPRAESEKKTEIRLEKNGDLVEAIKVICACGEEIIIQCQYPKAA